MILLRTGAIFFCSLLILNGAVEAKIKLRKPTDCSASMKQAIETYHKKQYTKVISLISDIRQNCSGNAVMDTALFFLGNAYLMTNQPILARTELDILQQDYPNSPFREHAQFLLGVCSFKETPTYERDQLKTRESIRQFAEFLELYPETSFADSVRHYIVLCRQKMAKKELMNTRFYEALDQYDAAIIYYRLFLQEFPESEYVPECKLSLARNLLKVSRIQEAKDVLQDLVDSNKDEALKKKILQLYSTVGNLEKNQQSLGKQ